MKLLIITLLGICLSSASPVMSAPVASQGRLLRRHNPSLSVKHAALLHRRASDRDEHHRHRNKHRHYHHHQRESSDVEQQQLAEMLKEQQKQIDAQKANIGTQQGLNELQHYLESLVGQVDPTLGDAQKGYVKTKFQNPSQSKTEEDDKTASFPKHLDNVAGDEVEQPTHVQSQSQPHPEAGEGEDRDEDGDETRKVTTGSSVFTQTVKFNESHENTTVSKRNKHDSNGHSRRHEAKIKIKSKSKSKMTKVRIALGSRSHPQHGGSTGSNALNSLLMQTLTGHATYFTPDTGACGWSNDELDDIVAISGDVFDKFSPKNNSNKNPLCGRKVKITYNNKSIRCTVADSCPTCEKTSLDLSPHAFKQLEILDKGVMKGMQWQFVD